MEMKTLHITASSIIVINTDLISDYASFYIELMNIGVSLYDTSQPNSSYWDETVIYMSANPQLTEQTIDELSTIIIQYCQDADVLEEGLQ